VCRGSIGGFVDRFGSSAIGDANDEGKNLVERGQRRLIETPDPRPDTIPPNSRDLLDHDLRRSPQTSLSIRVDAKPNEGDLA